MARKPKGSHRAYEEGIIRAYKERRGVAKSKPSEKKTLVIRISAHYYFRARNRLRLCR